MKYISFSFDDGRKDTYTIAYPVLAQHGFTCTVNMITDHLLDPTAHSKYGLREVMSIKDVLDLQSKGNEIACHGHTHKNTYEDICNCISTLESIGVDVNQIGFASPFSALIPEQLGGPGMLLDEKRIKYIRTGTQVRRAGMFYFACTMICEKLRLKWLFALLHKREICSYPAKERVILGVSITNNTTVGQILRLIDSMPRNSGVVLIFHSILPKQDCYDRWCWSADKFDALCKALSQKRDCNIINTSELFEE